MLSSAWNGGIQLRSSTKKVRIDQLSMKDSSFARPENPYRTFPQILQNSRRTDPWGNPDIQCSLDPRQLMDYYPPLEACHLGAHTDNKNQPDHHRRKQMENVIFGLEC